MARIVFASVAYLGDVAPFIEPANRLAGRGHEVTFLAPAGYGPVLSGQRFAVATYPLDFSARAMHADPVHERLMRHPFANQLRLGRYLMRAGLVADPAAGRASLLRELRGADVVVSHPTFGSAVLPVADHLGIPAVVGQLFPMMIPTSAWTPPMPDRARDFGRLGNRAAWRGLAAGSGLLMRDRAMNRYRRSLGVEPMRGNALLAWTAAARTVVLVSRHYFGDPPDDWGPMPLNGFSPWPAGDEPDEVRSFVDAGGDGAASAPVLVCLGTSAASSAGEMFATVAAGIESLGLRPLLLIGHAGNRAALGDRAGVFEFAPVARVAPRCRAAVVSGALGTLAAALTAGLPVVVLPQLFDQLWHGRRVEQLGVGIMVRRASQVAAAVAKIEADQSYRQRAQELGAKLAAEDGAAALADAVEAVCR